MYKSLLSFACLSLVSAGVMAATHPTSTNLGQKFSILEKQQTVKFKAKKNEYIVIFDTNMPNDEIDGIQNDIEQQNGSNYNALKRFSVVNGFAGRIPPGQMRKLEKDERVKVIEPDLSIQRTSLAATATSTYVPWGVDRLDQRTLPLDNSFNVYGDGAGVHAYIIDTGIHLTHNDFGGRAQWDFTASDVTDGNDDGNGHGTHMAGTVGGATYGVAKGVSLHAVKVINNNGVGTLSGLIEGIDYVTNNHQAPAVAAIGVSTGFSAALNQAVEASIAAGVSYSVPSGDHDADACNYSPGSVSGAITVAASTDTDAASIYSNSGSCVDLYAPGLYVHSAWHSSDIAHNVISHSPMAAAHAAGAAAIIRGNDPTCSAEQTKEKMLNNSYVGSLSGVPADTPNVILGTLAEAETGANCAGEGGSIINPDVAPDHLYQADVNQTITISYLPSGLTLNAENGSVETNANGTYSYTPNSGFVGIDAFEYSDSGQTKIAWIEVGLLSHGEYIANTSSGPIQTQPNIATLSNGQTAMVWLDDRNGETVMLQRFNAQGQLTSNPIYFIDILTNIGANLEHPNVVGVADDGVVVSWDQTYYDQSVGVSKKGVFAVALDGNNQMVGSEYQLDDGNGNYGNGQLAVLPNGNVVHLWQNQDNYETWVSVLSASGSQVVAPRVVLAGPTPHLAATISATSDGGFLVSSISNQQVVVRRFDENATLQGSATVSSQSVNPSGEHEQLALTEIAGGKYVVSWTVPTMSEGVADTVMARVMNLSGGAVTTEFVVSEGEFTAQRSSRLTALNTGGFMAVWESKVADSDDWGIYGRYFDGNGVAKSVSFKMSHDFEQSQTYADVEAMANGQVAMSYSYTTNQGSQVVNSVFSVATDNSDLLQANNGNNVLVGSNGFDVAFGYDGDDTFYGIYQAEGGSGNDVFYGGTFATGGIGNDTFTDVETVDAGDGDDIIFAGVSIDGGAGNDVVHGGYTVYAGSGDDELHASNVNNAFFGQDGFDVVYFSGALSDYTVTENADGSYLVVDNREGSPDASNYLSEVEAAQFQFDRIALGVQAQISWDRLVQVATDGSVAVDGIATISTQPSNGTLTWDAGQNAYIYTPAAGFSGVDSFTYVDAQGQSHTVRVEVGLGGSASAQTVISGFLPQVPSVTTLANGDMIVAWSEYITGGEAIVFQRFDAQGNALTQAVIVEDTAESGKLANVAARSDGGFIISYQYAGGHHFKWYDSNNQQVGDRGVLSNSAASSGLQTANVLSNDSFVQLWSANSHVYATIYNSVGAIVANNVVLFALDSVQDLNIQPMVDGSFVVAVTTSNQVFASRFDHKGRQIAPKVTVFDAVGQSTMIVNAALSVLTSGDYVVGWSQWAFQQGVMSAQARVIGANGTIKTDAIQMNTAAIDVTKRISLAALPNGGFIGSWERNAASGDADQTDWELLGNVFDANGNSSGSEFNVTVTVERDQNSGHLAVLANGDIAIAYTDNGSGVQRVAVSTISTGSVGDDVMTGSANNDILIGLEGSNVIYGEGGNDTILNGDVIFGGTGDDIFYGGSDIDGGDGIDKLYMSGVFSDYSITFVDGKLAYNDNRAGSPDGLTKFVNVERIIFADGYIASF